MSDEIEVIPDLGFSAFITSWSGVAIKQTDDFGDPQGVVLSSSEARQLCQWMVSNGFNEEQ